MKWKNHPPLACPIGNIGVSDRPMAAFSGLNESLEPPPSGDACSIVPPYHDSHQNGQQRWYILHRRFVDCHPGGSRGDMERVVAQWQPPVASDVALDMLHRAIPHALLQRLCMTIKINSKNSTISTTAHQWIFCSKNSFCNPPTLIPFESWDF